MKKGKKKDVLTLIEGDLINTKLLHDFRKLGINIDMYCTDSSRVIFRMIGIENPTEELYESYFEILNRVKNIDLSASRDSLKKLCEKILSVLLLNQASDGNSTK
jgi:hypothetical protein